MNSTPESSNGNAVNFLQDPSHPEYFEQGDTLLLSMSTGKNVVRSLRGVVVSISESRFVVLTELGDEIPFRSLVSKVGSAEYIVMGPCENELRVGDVGVAK
jgi:hypothetical protein